MASGVLMTIVEAFEARLEALGFVASPEIFDFNGVPSSIIDKAYRIETVHRATQALSGNGLNESWAIEIYIAYQGDQGMRAAWGAAHDDREAIEDDILTNNAIAALAVVLPDQDSAAQKYLSSFLVSKVVFRVDYVRQL